MSTAIRRFPPVAAELPFKDVIAAWRSRQPAVECLRDVGAYLGVRHLFPVNSGRAALYVALKASLSPGSKVIIPGYTCFTVPAAVVKAGMTPVLSDSDHGNLGYDLSALGKTVKQHPDTKAIVVCHLFGIAVDMAAIRRAVGSEVLIIDDAAQAFGLTVKGKLLGADGHVGFYSFGRGKNLALGGGGLLVTNNDFLAERIGALLRDGIEQGKATARGFLEMISYNLAVHPLVFGLASRLPGIRLGISEFNPDFDVHKAPVEKIRLLRRMYQTVEILNAQRLEQATRYLSALGGGTRITIPRSPVDGRPGSLRFPILVANAGDRARLLKHAAKMGWGFSTMYPTALNRIGQTPQLAGFDLKGAEYIARTIVTLPTHRLFAAYDKRHGVAETIGQMTA